MKTLKRDPDVDLAESSVDTYISYLADHDLVNIKQVTTGSNRVSFTTAGLVAREHISSDTPFVLRGNVGWKGTLLEPFTPT